MSKKTIYYISSDSVGKVADKDGDECLLAIGTVVLIPPHLLDEIKKQSGEAGILLIDYNE